MKVRDFVLTVCIVYLLFGAVGLYLISKTRDEFNIKEEITAVYVASWVLGVVWGGKDAMS
jgi:hypothetical protein